jgi:hypothetical protein
VLENTRYIFIILFSFLGYSIFQSFCVLKQHVRNNKRIMFFLFYKTFHGLGAMAHVCNPSYLGGRDLEDQSLRPA